MSIKKNALLVAAMCMADVLNNRERYETESHLPIYCGDCKHCPNNGKTFCRFSGHSVKKSTPALYCEHFRNKNIVEDDD